ncbi:hypothetical protein VNO80_06654 [Phaseolus coccineus]|uniref:Uncharacterized protein n=1 Tax=Phaseolus coccineus TaxID=3886 RepID=A0AAN9NML4_PHACN
MLRLELEVPEQATVSSNVFACMAFDRDGKRFPPTPTSASNSAVEQPIPEDKPYIALLQLEGERKRILEEIVHFVEGQMVGPVATSLDLSRTFF